MDFVSGLCKSLRELGSSKLLIVSTKRRIIPMDKSIGFLIGGMIYLFALFLIVLFFMYHARKQLKSKR